eukprot:12402088-Karenia_brevis.AAC.1
MDMAETLHEKGWRCLWGRPQDCQNRVDPAFTPSIWNAAHGGVGILVKKGLLARHVPTDTALRQWLWETGRWVHIVVALGQGKDMLHIIAIYGYTRAQSCPQAKKSNEEFLKRAFEATAELGNVPVVILGDFNTELDNSEVLQTAVSTGVWVE